MSREENTEELRQELQIERLAKNQPLTWRWWAGLVFLVICLTMLAGCYYLATVNDAWQYGEVGGFLIGGTIVVLLACGVFVYATIKSRSKLTELKHARPGAKIIPFRRKPN